MEIDIIKKRYLSQLVPTDTLRENSGARSGQTRGTTPIKTWCLQGSATDFAVYREVWVVSWTKHKICSQMIWI